MEVQTLESYKLYASKDFGSGVNERWSFIPRNLEYILVYATEKPKEGDYLELPPDTPLSDEEKSWLIKAKTTINLEYMGKHKVEYDEFLENFLKLFEEELKKEKEKQSVNK